VNGRIRFCVALTAKENGSLYNFNALHQMKEWLELALRLLTLPGESMDAHGDLSVPESQFLLGSGNNNKISMNERIGFSGSFRIYAGG
jgi:hypothetical protein